MTNDEQIKWLRDFIATWEQVQGNSESEEYDGKIDELTAKYNEFLAAENLPEWSADEVLSRLIVGSWVTDITEIILEMDGDKFTLKEFLHTNTDPDVESPPAQDIIAVIKLAPGEFVNIGINRVSRVK